MKLTSLAYVAISRVRSLEGLELDQFTKDCVKVNSKVLNFYGIDESEINAKIERPKLVEQRDVQSTDQKPFKTSTF
jgi:hypothetical protein